MKGDAIAFLQDSEADGVRMQISCGIRHSMAPESAVLIINKGVGGCFSRFSPEEGERNHGRAPDGRSCAHEDIDPPEGCCGPGHGIHQRNICNPNFPGAWRPVKELCGVSFLGERLLGFDGRQTTGGCASIYPEEKEDKRLKQLEVKAL